MKILEPVIILVKVTRWYGQKLENMQGGGSGADDADLSIGGAYTMLQ